jgi:hypothetical protein
MRRGLSVVIFGATVLIGTLILPGERVSADKVEDSVVVTNVPLPVTVGNFPASPRPFTGRDTYTIPDEAFGVSGGGTFVAPENATIETITARIVLPAGQKPVLGMFLPDDTGRIVGTVWVPLQFQASSPGGDHYVGTVTNAHAPMGTTNLGRLVNFVFDRDGNSGIAFAHVTVIGLPGSQS